MRLASFSALMRMTSKRILVTRYVKIQLRSVLATINFRTRAPILLDIDAFQLILTVQY